MAKYGQYCPIAQALELIGDRWTLLIIRDMLTGTQHFNALRRGLPGISKALLAKRLRQLQKGGIVEKRETTSGSNNTEYHLTQAGLELNSVLNALLLWGTVWAFDEPSPKQLDPLLLLWWMHGRVNVKKLPENPVVIQFNFRGAKICTYWLLLKPDDVTICMTDPGYEINLLVTADLAAFFKLWLGRINYDEALRGDDIQVEGIPEHVSSFPDWFLWSPAAPSVRAAQVGSRVTTEHKSCSERPER